MALNHLRTLAARVGLMAAVFVAGLVVLPAARNWQSGWGPSRTVGRFVEALRDGDRQAVAQLVSPEKARSLQADPQAWEPSQQLQYRIDRVEVDGDFARVHATLSEFGLSLQPEFSLERTSDGRWLVVEIEGITGR